MDIRYGIMRSLYTLCHNGQTILDVRQTVPRWFPVSPRLRPEWLRLMVQSALLAALRN
jgi:hypothetical protein